MTTKENIENLYEQAEQKARKNKDRQAYIYPSEFGFGRTSEGTQACLNLLKSDSRFKSVTMSGKDLLDIKLFQGDAENEATDL